MLDRIGEQLDTVPPSEASFEELQGRCRELHRSLLEHFAMERARCGERRSDHGYQALSLHHERQLLDLDELFACLGTTAARRGPGLTDIVRTLVDELRTALDREERDLLALPPLLRVVGPS
jgi:hypothetical protein